MGEGVRGDRDFFISGLAPRFPAHVHECVVGPCPSRGNQAIALGSDVGGRVAGVHPRQMRVLSESAWLRSCLYFPVFLQKKIPHAAAGAVAQRKTRRGMPPGLLA